MTAVDEDTMRARMRLIGNAASALVEQAGRDKLTNIEVTTACALVLAHQARAVQIDPVEALEAFRDLFIVVYAETKNFRPKRG